MLRRDASLARQRVKTRVNPHRDDGQIAAGRFRGELHPWISSMTTSSRLSPSSNTNVIDEVLRGREPQRPDAHAADLDRFAVAQLVDFDHASVFSR